MAAAALFSVLIKFLYLGEGRNSKVFWGKDKGHLLMVLKEFYFFPFRASAPQKQRQKVRRSRTIHAFNHDLIASAAANGSSAGNHNQVEMTYIHDANFFNNT